CAARVALPAVGAPADVRARRPHHVAVLALPLGPRAEALDHGPAFPFGSLSIGETDGQLDELTERRRAEPPPLLELRVVEGSRVAARDGLDGGMLRLIALDDRQPG